jgi:DNA-binding CsgD family transcriptional regulator
MSGADRVIKWSDRSSKCPREGEVLALMAQGLGNGIMFDNGSGGSRRLLLDLPMQNGACPVCGAEVYPEQITSSAPRLALRAVIPQPIAAALLLVQSLSVRERAVFEFLGKGYDNRSIARELSISERTVKRHITVVLAKLRLESRLQAGLVAFGISSIHLST